VVTRKHIIAVTGSVLVAAAMTGCAPAGASNGYGDDAGAPALANATGEANAQPSASAAAPATTAPAAPVKLTEELKGGALDKMGKVVTDQKGWILYRFDKDTAKPAKSNCDGKCAAIWPPALTDGNPKLSGVDATLVGTVTRTDGTQQLTLAGWPLYRYIGDPKPGAWKGQNVGGTWFVVAPDGKKNLSCLPTPPPKAVEPPAADDAGASTGGGAGGY
jgi:predicted lipoprotein with Yx(FWY)xxD motif